MGCNPHFVPPTIPFRGEGQDVKFDVMTTNNSFDHVHDDDAVDNHDDEGVDEDDDNDADDDDDDDNDDDDDDDNDSADKLSIGYKSNNIIAMTSPDIHLKPLLRHCPITAIVDILQAQIIKAYTTITTVNMLRAILCNMTCKEI